METKVCGQSEEEMEVKKGPWTVEEDFALIHYITRHGEGRWNSLARCAGLNRTGKSCRLRWLNYLRPDVRRGNITLEEQLLILELHSRWGNRWSKIAQHLPGRTDNEIKNYWRTRVQKHAKQLKCDVNSKQFKDTMRYLWMPRLAERIQAQAATRVGAASAAPADSSFPCSSLLSYDPSNSQNTTAPPPVNYGAGIQTHSPENSSAVASSESFGTPISDLTDSYNNYAANQGSTHDLCQGNELLSFLDHNLTSPTACFNEEVCFPDEQYGSWMEVSESLCNDVDDVWFL